MQFKLSAHRWALCLRTSVPVLARRGII